MYVSNLDPVLVHLGPLEIRWYGLVYVFGFFLTIWWLQHAQKQGKLAISSDDVWDFAVYLMVGVLVGARLFMLFWEPNVYVSHPLNLLKIWEGGMSFHGAFVGVVVAGWLFCRKKNINFWRMADIVSVPAIFALALGRLANFVNGELVGRPWDGRWCVIFPEYGDVCRHPNMIYSFFQRMAVFGALMWLSSTKAFHQFKPGFIFWNFVFLEGAGRIIVDFFREDTLYFGFSLGQWFSLGMVIVALCFFWKRHRDDWRIVRAYLKR
ncbi:prolipoprotein diacylglyceryl transferase [Candidatus Woesearchaeota archaeon]|nr:prolipoprotein diacylglyceryl transferase [Candidatus Woesearchaeota archaeon]